MLTRGNIFLLMFRLAHLFVASFFVLCVVVPAGWCDGPFNPCPPMPGPPGPVTLREIMFAAVIFVWFVSAIGLFFRSRLAWFGSVLGVGSAIFFAACFLLAAIRDSFFPGAADAEHLAPGFMLARILAEVSLLGFASAFLAFSVGLFVGLIKSRGKL